MQFLRRLKASKMNPLGPDIANAPWMAFNLSGTELRFHCPPHELAGDQAVTASQTLNIYQDDIYQPWAGVEDRGMSAHLLYTGWKYWDSPLGDGAIGYVMFDVHLQRRHPHYRKIDSLLKAADTRAWIIRYCDDVWGALNRELWEERDSLDSPVIPEEDFWRFPQSADEICKVSFQGMDWYCFIAEMTHGPKRHIWNLPISDDHILNFHFQPSALNREYYEPDHDLDGAVEKTVQEFMSHVHVKLSPDAQQRYDEVMAEVTQAG